MALGFYNVVVNIGSSRDRLTVLLGLNASPPIINLIYCRPFWRLRCGNCPYIHKSRSYGTLWHYYNCVPMTHCEFSGLPVLAFAFFGPFWPLRVTFGPLWATRMCPEHIYRQTYLTSGFWNSSRFLDLGSGIIPGFWIRHESILSCLYSLIPISAWHIIFISPLCPEHSPNTDRSFHFPDKGPPTANFSCVQVRMCAALKFVTFQFCTPIGHDTNWVPPWVSH